MGSQTCLLELGSLAHEQVRCGAFSKSYACPTMSSSTYYGTVKRDIYLCGTTLMQILLSGPGLVTWLYSIAQINFLT